MKYNFACRHAPSVRPSLERQLVRQDDDTQPAPGQVVIDQRSLALPLSFWRAKLCRGLSSCSPRCVRQLFSSRCVWPLFKACARRRHAKRVSGLLQCAQQYELRSGLGCSASRRGGPSPGRGAESDPFCKRNYVSQRRWCALSQRRRPGASLFVAVVS